MSKDANGDVTCEKVSFESYIDFSMNFHLLPTDVALDVFKRIADWSVDEEKENSNYVKKQLEYASKFIAKG